MNSNKYNKLYFLDDSKVFRETWKLLSKDWTTVCFESVEDFEDFLKEDAEAKLSNSIIVTDMRFSKDSKYDGFDALNIVKTFNPEVKVFLCTTGIVSSIDGFSAVLDKNPRLGLSQIEDVLEGDKNEEN